MRYLTLSLVLVAFLPSLPAQYDADAPVPIARFRGALVLGGGGELPGEVYDQFVTLAGGEDAKIALLGVEAPTEADRAPFLKRGATESGLKSIKLPDATGIWIVGEDPGAFAKKFRGSPTEKMLRELIAKGKVVGGNGAVTRALAKVMIPSEAADAAMGQGLDLVPGAVLDDDYTGSKRKRRLLETLAAQPDLVGLGIDAKTAIVVHQRWIDVLGEGSVHGCIAASAKRTLRIDRMNRRESPASQRRRPATAEPGRARPGRGGRRGRGRGRSRNRRSSRLRRLGDLIALSRSAQARAYPKFPAYSPVPPAVKKGTLIIAGGGGMPPGLMERFIEFAGGKDAPLVYVPCEERETVSRTPGMLAAWKRLGATDVDWVHTKDRNVAHTDEALLEKLRRAKGVWFGGGRQWNLVDSYQNTTAHKLMHDVLARGGVIGGSSAGASIQGSYMCRGNSLGNRDSMAEGYEIGLGFLTGVAIDQHFTQRNRLPDMTGLAKTYPKLLGIGLDEAASIVVRGTVAEVVARTDRNVNIYDRSQPVVPGELDHLVLSHGQRYDLKARETLAVAPPKK